MRTIVVGDMHQKQHLILPIADSAVRLLGARRVVLLGDYCDDYSPNRDETDAEKLLRGLKYQVDWVDRARTRGLRIDVLLGNHDVQYLIERQGPGTNLNCIVPVRRMLAQMNVRMAAAVDGWLATHAGLTSQFADIVLEIDVEAEPFDEPSYTAESLADQLNTAFDHALTEMFEHGNDEELLLFNLCGPGRGGISIPGPLWASTSELTVLGMPHLNQIIGHTPVYSVRELEEQGFRGERFMACDTFSTDFEFRPLGDGSVLLIDDETHEMRPVTPEEVDCEWTGMS
ncbi:MAG: metallophosphoesterase family protein [Collinsella intestinalis]|uniref:Calcineurin-like phosphoesterase domain-containing protein n=1 Tax=Collinsella intestinalis TaxID=147207 RepID=A0A6N3D2H3_9ACTN